MEALECWRIWATHCILLQDVMQLKVVDNSARPAGQMIPVKPVGQKISVKPMEEQVLTSGTSKKLIAVAAPKIHAVNNKVPAPLPSSLSVMPWLSCCRSKTGL